MATNRERLAHGLPPLPFVPPTLPEVKPKSVDDALKPSKVIIFLDANGLEIGRSVSSVLSFTDLVFSRDGGAYLAASDGNTFYLFDAMSATMLKKRDLEVSTEVNSLDVNQLGEIAVAAVAHPTRNERGWAVDRGLADPRLVMWWSFSNSRMSTYTFDGNLQIPRDRFCVALADSARRFLAMAGDQIFVFENPDTPPREFSLAQNFPNPFLSGVKSPAVGGGNLTTEIWYDLPLAGKVKLSIFNTLGQEVRGLVDEFKPAGEYAARWDGKDDRGRVVASGIYLYRISYSPSESSAQAMVRTGKMSLVR
jgi:hypothetical protein